MKKLFISAAAIGALFVTPAFALDIENQDGKDHTVIVGVDNPSSMNMVTIKAGKTAKGLCGDVCSVSVEGSSEQDQAAGLGSKFIIKDGKLIEQN